MKNPPARHRSYAGFTQVRNERSTNCFFCGEPYHPDLIQAHMNHEHPGWAERIFRMMWGAPGKRSNPQPDPNASQLMPEFIET